MLWRACILILALLLPQTAHSFVVIEDTFYVGHNSPVFHIAEKITKETWVRFVINLPTIKTVELNSQGGYIVYAEAIAKLIRDNKINTVVRTGSGCFSACVLIFQSGIKRTAYTGSAFMLHPATIEVAGVDIEDKWSTTRYNAWLMRYGMKTTMIRRLRAGGDVYFDARTALWYEIATEVLEK